MSTKFICDFCLQEITASYTRMAVQTIEEDAMTSANVAEEFEFHPSCYNSLQGLITSFRGAQEVKLLDPTPEPPKTQPTNPDDPEPPEIIKKPEPVPDEPVVDKKT